MSEGVILSRLEILSKHRTLISQMLLALFLVSIGFTTLVISPFLIPESSTILKTMIEVNATMLGFWGIILVYCFTSLDKRLESTETQKFEVAKSIAENQECSISEAMNFPNDHLKFLETKTQRLIKSFNRLRRHALINSVMFIISIIVSVIGLGIPENAVALILIITVSLYYFVAGVIFVFMSFWELRAR